MYSTKALPDDLDGVCHARRTVAGLNYWLIFLCFGYVLPFRPPKKKEKKKSQSTKQKVNNPHSGQPSLTVPKRVFQLRPSIFESLAQKKIKKNKASLSGNCGTKDGLIYV